MHAKKTQTLKQSWTASLTDANWHKASQWHTSETDVFSNSGLDAFLQSVLLIP